jgi:Fe-S cluster assembly protein SufD
MVSQQLVRENFYKEPFEKSLVLEKTLWLKELRANAFAYFSENGFPTMRNEEWKYTNVATIAKEAFTLSVPSAVAGGLSERSGESIAGVNPSATADGTDLVFDECRKSVLVFRNGKYLESLSSLNALNNAKILSFSEAANDTMYGEVFRSKLGSLVNTEKNGFTALNTAFIGDGAFVIIPKNVKIEAPIQLLFTTDDGNVSFPRVLVVAEEFAEATIIETFNRTDESTYLTNAVIEVSLANEAKVKHYRVQRESQQAFHIGSTGAAIGRGSVYDATNINLGGKLSRHDIDFRFNSEGGEAFVDGLYLIGDDQHHDTHSVIDHALPNCISHQTYKGIVDGKAHAVFNGKIFVRENASGTDGYQSNKNLLLSNDARVDTKPQLEIYNDDVKCAHGATVGQLEEEELFYLLSRGLNEGLARNLLTYGFAEEIVNKIEIESIKRQLDEAVLNRLNAKLEI